MVETTYEAQIRQIAAFDDLLEYFQGQKPRWDGDVAAAQAAYAALSSNLKGVIASQMDFFGTVDPDVVNPTNVRGGTFQTIAALVAAAPACSGVQINLLPGKTYTVDTRITLRNQKLYIQQLGVGDPPIVKFTAFVGGGFNTVNSFMPRGMCCVKFYKCNIELPTAKIDDGLPWSSFTGLMGYDVGLPQAVGLHSCLVSGGMAGVEIGIISSGPATLGLYTATLDGPLVAVVGGGGTTALISGAQVTLSNGAVLIGASSTLGTNYLTNAV